MTARKRSHDLYQFYNLLFREIIPAMMVASETIVILLAGIKIAAIMGVNNP